MLGKHGLAHGAQHDAEHFDGIMLEDAIIAGIAFADGGVENGGVQGELRQGVPFPGEKPRAVGGVEQPPAAALDEVSDEHRRIVLLRDVSGMSYTEIAEILEVSEGTVKSRLSRARIALRKILLKRGNLFHLPSSKDMEGGEEHE